MNTQTLTKSAMICSFTVVLPDEDFSTEEPIRASSCDYGFDFDEEEVTRELLVPLPASILPQSNAEADANELEASHLWFLS